MDLSSILGCLVVPLRSSVWWLPLSPRSQWTHRKWAWPDRWRLGTQSKSNKNGIKNDRSEDWWLDFFAEIGWLQLHLHHRFFWNWMGFRFKIHHFQPNLGRRLAWPWDAMPGWRRKWPCSTRHSPGSSGATRWASGQETSRRNGQKVGKTTTQKWGWTKHSIWMMDLGCLMMFDDVWCLDSGSFIGDLWC